ncbi:MAG: TetR/AcrR family transcriptional regulator [Pseudomonadota bacterium]
MPKPRTYERSDLIKAAMEQFWAHGFYATSIRDLVAVTGVSRHGLYAEFDDKHGIFLAALESYLETFVEEAFGRVEEETASVREIRDYFEYLIALAEENGLPGPGCLMANSMVEVGPHEEAFKAVIQRHLDRLRTGFAEALETGQARGEVDPALDAERFAEFLTISAQGLWSASRMISDAAHLRAYVDTLLAPLDP